MNYEFHPAAEVEHLENVGYYELKCAGLGANYLSDFETTMKKSDQAFMIGNDIFLTDDTSI
jgi:hypothetical protein